ncbi:colicin-E7 immunity domain protein [Pseudomonas fluorescens]|uniref:Colicin-E7 immunity domain protein n=1 Tax=Pseudomonas fluorescens TaxID=294 RepID=A0A0P8XRU5_PSEFL|nr:bacteriocin immunity protein [Pseudomonas fluorescens]KPU59807.1 colicin-E7 immunity domain protein [Pseudomonas fluorescens]
MELKATLKDYTESEFQALVNKIWAVDLSRQDHDRLINHFDLIVGHPEGADLLFYPNDKFNSNSPESVVYYVKDWHRKQGGTAFKEESVSIPAPSPAMTPLARGFAQVQKIAADVAASEVAVETAFGLFGQGIEQLRDQLNGNRKVSDQEADIRALEHVQHSAVIAVRKFEFWKMTVQFAKNDAQRNLTYARTEQAQWQSVAQQINALQDRYTEQLAAFSRHHRSLHDEAEALLIKAQDQLIRSRRLARAEPGQSGYMIPVSLAFAHKRPEVLLGGGPSGLLLSQQIDLQTAIRSVVAEFTWRNTSGKANNEALCAAVLRFEFSSRADTQIYGLCVPLVELTPLEGQDWLSLAMRESEIDLSFRIGTTTVPAQPGTMFQGLREVKTLAQVYITPTPSANVPARVRVRAAQFDQQRGAFVFTVDGTTPVTVCWSTPVPLESQVPAAQLPLRRVGFVQSLTVPLVEPITAERATIRFTDYIVVFPDDSGLDPLYVMLSTS